MMSEPVLTDDGVECHSCGSVFSRVGYHWSNGLCEYPKLEDETWSTIVGLMLGDGTLRTHTSHPFVQTYMVNRPFLEWLDDYLGWLSTGVSLYRTAERSAEISRDNGFVGADADRYHDVYVVQTRTHPRFHEFEAWYENGDRDRKQLPDGIDLDPTMASIWYACDGSLSWDRRYPGARPYATIGISSAVSNSDRAVDMFERSYFPHSPVVDENAVRFTVDETADLLDWMGDAPPGFEYKWEQESLDRYEELKARALGDDVSEDV